MSRVRPWATVTAAVVALLAAAVVTLALTAAPASAFSQWQHDGAIGCASCHSQGTPTDATCQNCHAGYQSYPGDTCWTCHYPGQDTTPYWTTSPTPSPTGSPTATPTESPTATPTPTPTETTSACSQECHLWNSAQKEYTVPIHARRQPAPRVDQRLP